MTLCNTMQAKLPKKAQKTGCERPEAVESLTRVCQRVWCGFDMKPPRHTKTIKIVMQFLYIWADLMVKCQVTNPPAPAVETWRSQFYQVAASVTAQAMCCPRQLSEAERPGCSYQRSDWWGKTMFVCFLGSRKMTKSRTITNIIKNIKIH